MGLIASVSSVRRSAVSLPDSRAAAHASSERVARSDTRPSCPRCARSASISRMSSRSSFSDMLSVAWRSCRAARRRSTSSTLLNLNLPRSSLSSPVWRERGAERGGRGEGGSRAARPFLTSLSAELRAASRSPSSALRSSLSFACSSLDGRRRRARRKVRQLGRQDPESPRLT